MKNIKKIVMVVLGAILLFAELSYDCGLIEKRGEIRANDHVCVNCEETDEWELVDVLVARNDDLGKTYLYKCANCGHTEILKTSWIEEKLPMGIWKTTNVENK